MNSPLLLYYQNLLFVTNPKKSDKVLSRGPWIPYGRSKLSICIRQIFMTSVYVCLSINTGTRKKHVTAVAAYMFT